MASQKKYVARSDGQATVHGSTFAFRRGKVIPQSTYDAMGEAARASFRPHTPALSRKSDETVTVAPHGTDPAAEAEGTETDDDADAETAPRRRRRPATSPTDTSDGVSESAAHGEPGSTTTTSGPVDATTAATSAT